jgi:hypothetical protein
VLSISEFKQYRIFWVWQQVTPDVRQALISFWQDNAAIKDAFEAWRRTFEVACVALNPSGQIIGVSSVYSALGAGAPYWFYRTFIRKDCRDVGLAQRLFTGTRQQLALAYTDEPQAPVGMMVVLENPKLERPSGTRINQRGGLSFLGCNEHGQSVWHLLFQSSARQEAP